MNLRAVGPGRLQPLEFLRRPLGFPGGSWGDHPVRPCLVMNWVGVCPMSPRPGDPRGRSARPCSVTWEEPQPNCGTNRQDLRPWLPHLGVLPVARATQAPALFFLRLAVQPPLLSSAPQYTGGYDPTQALCLAWPWRDWGAAALGSPSFAHLSCKDTSPGPSKGVWGQWLLS